jgi:DNA-binding winged helix-turn-helix (wHTH) protein
MPSVTSNLYSFGEFLLDAQTRILRLRGVPIALTAKAFDVLLLLIQRNGQVVGKNELMDAVWPDSFVQESNLTQTVFMLRKALGETSSQRFILTVQGRGYRFAPDVKPVDEAVIPHEDSSQRGHVLRASRTAAIDKPLVSAKRKIMRSALALQRWLLPLALWPFGFRRLLLVERMPAFRCVPSPYFRWTTFPAIHRRSSLLMV